MNPRERGIRNLAKDDPVVNQLLYAYDVGRIKSWEEFLTQCVSALVSVKNALHDHIDEQVKLKGPHPIVLNVTSEQKEDILTQLKR